MHDNLTSTPQWAHTHQVLVVVGVSEALELHCCYILEFGARRTQQQLFVHMVAYGNSGRESRVPPRLHVGSGSIGGVG